MSRFANVYPNEPCPVFQFQGNRNAVFGFLAMLAATQHMKIDTYWWLSYLINRGADNWN